MAQGKLIAIEGADGAGKSTQIRMLREHYPEAIFTREPGGTPYAEEIRALIFAGDSASAETMFFLFQAARMEHLDKLILPAVTQGKLVITDRFDLSTFAYQLRGQFETTSLDQLFWSIRQTLIVSKIGHQNLHYIYLDMDIESSMKRLASRAGEVTHFDLREQDFHERVRIGGHEFMDKLAQDEGQTNSSCHLVDAGFAPELVHKDVLATVKKIISA